MSNVISLNDFKKQKEMTPDLRYQAKILKMDKLELLEEMVRFQEERSKMGFLTPFMLINGPYLFKALEESSETNELRLLTRSYRRHLEYELELYKKKVGA
jgi:hypothetical protein